MKKLKIVTLMGFVVPLLAACGGSHESAEGQPHRLADTGWVTMSGEDLYFRGADVIHGFAGCNSFTGQASVKTSEISLVPSVVTAKSCLDPQDPTQEDASVMEREKQFMSALQNTRRWRLVDTQLQLLDDRGGLVLQLKPQSPGLR